MAKCPFATWHPLSGPSGSMVPHVPFRIVHHTTEGSTLEGAISTLGSEHYDSHFVVDATRIYQLIDTGMAARALRHSGPVQTNREGAVQIEMVGFAGKPKNRQTLALMAKLCRWIEATHNVPQVWPNGFPKPPVDGQDPGGHNRNAENWATKGGHYGHCHVPENIHWDPAYTAEEVAIVTPGAVAPVKPA
jgi:hypothetical protein